jgi:hypothetical protein
MELVDAVGKRRSLILMDIINPPPRITATTSKNLSAKRAQTRLQAFLDDFENRNSALKGGDKTVTVQLQKLNRALLDERQRQKATGEGR